MKIINLVLYNLMEVHPLHSLIVHFPIALTSSALFFILLALWRKDDTLEKVAFANIALATASTLVAGFTGLQDNNDIYDGVAPNSNVKIILASILLAVTLLITVFRWRNSDLFHSSLRIIYISGYFLSFALVSVLGFLGGVILYGFHDNTVASNNSTATAVSSEASSKELIPVTSNEEKTEVSFSRDVLPIFESRCTKCHGGLKTEEGLDLTTYEMLMAGSKNGSILFIGDSENSPLVKLSVEGKMPKRGPKLTPGEIQMLIDWIDTGALNN